MGIKGTPLSAQLTTPVAHYHVAVDIKGKAWRSGHAMSVRTKTTGNRVAGVNGRGLGGGNGQRKSEIGKSGRQLTSALVVALGHYQALGCLWQRHVSTTSTWYRQAPNRNDKASVRVQEEICHR